MLTATVVFRSGRWAVIEYSNGAIVVTCGFKTILTYAGRESSEELAE